MDPEIRHDPEARKFSTTVDGKEAYLRYALRGEGTLDFKSTFVPPELRGRGLAAKVVARGFEYAEENGFKVIPTCPYVETWLERHPRYRELVVAG